MRLCYLFLLLLPFFAVGQGSDSLNTAPRLMLKVSLADLAGTQYSRVVALAAVRMAPRHYLEVGGGKLFNSGIAFRRTKWQTLSGYTFEASYRFYARPLTRIDEYGTVLWLGGGFAQEEIKGSINADFDRHDGAYSQRMRYSVNDRRTGGKVSIGLFNTFGKHLMMDAGVALFIFDRRWSFSDLPEDVVFLKNGSQHWHYGTGEPHQKTEARFSLVLRLGWLFY